MPDQFNLVSDLIKTHQNLGAYESPFSGSGVEFEPVWTNLPARGVGLHDLRRVQKKTQAPSLTSWRCSMKGTEALRYIMR